MKDRRLRVNDSDAGTGGGGGTAPSQYLAAQLTLFQPAQRGQIIPTYYYWFL